jgi:hypothetical protein
VKPFQLFHADMGERAKEIAAKLKDESVHPDLGDILTESGVRVPNDSDITFKKKRKAGWWRWGLSWDQDGKEQKYTVQVKVGGTLVAIKGPVGDVRLLKWAEDLKLMEKVDEDPGRFLLAMLPLRDGQLGDEGSMLPMTLDARGSELSRALRKDKHLKAFRNLPSKDNGLDIEGLVVDPMKDSKRRYRVLLGLRGPVLRGMAIILELHVRAAPGHGIELLRLPNGKVYDKHFLYLDGLGIRGMTLDGGDLLILAGPTMDLSGPFSIFRVKDAFDLLSGYRRRRFSDLQGKIERVVSLDGDLCGRPEGFTRLDDKHFLVVFDSPTGCRINPCGTVEVIKKDERGEEKRTREREEGVEADLLTIP